MKVYLGPYKQWIGPYQISELLKYIGIPKDYRMNVGEWLAGKDEDSLLFKFCLWLETKRKRKVKVKIDYYDIWNADSTLAYIILPLLKEIQLHKHGSPNTDDEDVPEELRSTVSPPKNGEYGCDGNIYLRWEWILNEMIWTFEQLQEDSNGDAQFFPDKRTYLRDEHMAYNDRINNGLRLFGKYYQALWD
jgi:hypothetical protein